MSVLRCVGGRTAEHAPFTSVSRAMSPGMGAAMFGRDCVSLAVLHWAASRFLAYFSGCVARETGSHDQPTVQSNFLFSVIGRETCD